MDLKKANVNILDPNSLDFVNRSDDYSSLIYTRKAYEPSVFEAHWASLPTGCEKGARLMLDTDGDRFGIVHTVELDSYEDNEYIVSGFDVRGILKKRIILPTSDGYDSYNAPYETIMYGLVDKNAVNPTNSNRKLTGLSCLADQGLGDTVTYQNSYGELMEELTKLSEASGLCTKITYNHTTKLFVFSVFAGRDLTYGNTAGNDPVIFSQKFSNIGRRSLTISNADYRNCAYIAGQGEAADRTVATIGDAYAGWDRYELFKDARDVSDSSSATLTDRGNTELAQYSEVDSYTAEIDSDGYRTRWDLGDKVTVLDTETGIRQDQQIISIKEIYQTDGLSIEVEFGNPLKTVRQMLRRDAIQNGAAFGGVSGSVLYYTGIEPLAPREGDIWI